MTRRPRTISRPSSETANQLPPSQPNPVKVGYTGRYLVLAAPGEFRAAKLALHSGAGVSITSVQGQDAVVAAQDVPAGEGLMFEDLGVAVVNVLPDQANRMSAAVAGADSLTMVEPERYVYASTGVDVSYLVGYRDAINHLVENVLGSSPGAPSIRPLGISSSFDESSLTWGLQTTDVATSRFTGKGVRIAILDTGLDLRHPDFLGRVQENLQAKSFVQNVLSVQDGNGHGTHCAGIACGIARPSRLPRFGVAPDAELYVGKVLDDTGTGTDSSILGGLQWAMTSKCDIVSMSLGARVEEGASYSAIFEQAAKRAAERGCVVFAAAGNESRRPQSVRPVSHPANCPSIVAVAAIDQGLAVAYFSNAGLNPDGGQIDIAGPGVDCMSSWPSPILYQSESGTSMGTPHVAGIAALFAEANPQVRGPHLVALMLQAARRLPAASADVGSGLVQAP